MSIAVTTREQLIRELEKDGESFFGGGFWNNIVDLSLTILTIFASLVATVLAATDSKDVTRWIMAMLAALPAAASSLQRIIGVRDRSNWYFLYAARVRALATQLKYGDSPNVAEFAKKRAELEIEMEKEWLKIGHSNEAAPSRRTTRHGQ